MNARIAGPAADLYLAVEDHYRFDPAEPGRTRRRKVEVSGDRALAELVRTGWTTRAPTFGAPWRPAFGSHRAAAVRHSAREGERQV